MEIQAFGYLGVGASNLDDWAAFATSKVGMQAVDRASSMRARCIRARHADRQGRERDETGEALRAR